MIEKNIYDNIDPGVYETRREKNKIDEYQYEHWMPSIAAAIAKYSKDSVVLDLGCGPGNYSFEMAKYAKKVFGIDSSKRMLDYAKRKYPGINFIYADATNSPIKSSCIDAVFSFGLFEYVKNKENLMREISRVLKPGGISVILAPNRYSFPRFLHAIVCTIIGKERKCDEPSFGQMLKMFRIFDFEIISYKMDDGLFFLPYKFDKLFFGKKTWLLIESCFKIFKRNPISMNMLFVVRKFKSQDLPQQVSSIRFLRNMLKGQYYKLENKIPFIKIFKNLYIKMCGKKMPRRYEYLFSTVRQSRAKKIMEIGTWTGRHALKMIEEAKKYFNSEEIEYYGFDLFENLDRETSSKEFSIPPPSLKEVKEKLEKTGAKIYLYKGYSQDTLPLMISKLPKMDFIYIDGGHSLGTIENDWKYAQKVMDEKTIVIFDDYWNRDDAGCKKVVENIDKNKFNVEILPIQDKFKKNWGVLTINFVKVKKK